MKNYILFSIKSRVTTYSLYPYPLPYQLHISKYALSGFPLNIPLLPQAVLTFKFPPTFFF